MDKIEIAVAALDSMKASRKGKHVVEINQVWPLIKQKLDEKFTIKDVYKTLKEVDAISCGYSNFLRVVKQLLSEAETAGSSQLLTRKPEPGQREVSSENSIGDVTESNSAVDEKTLGMSTASASLAQAKERVRGTNYAKLAKK